jgi:hypothetical protein
MATNIVAAYIGSEATKKRKSPQPMVNNIDLDSQPLTFFMYIM